MSKNSCYIIENCIHPRYVAYVYNGEFVSLIGNQRVWIFPPTSKILFHLSLALKWYQNFQDWATPVGGDTWFLLKKGNLFPSWEISELEFSHQNRKILFSLRLFFIWYRKIQDWPSSLGGVTWSKYTECWPVRRKEGKRRIRIRITRKTTYVSVCEAVWKKSRKQSSRTVTRPSADFQTRFFRRFKRLRKFLRRVAQLSRDSGWWSRDCRPTVKQRFFDVSSDLVKFWKKSLNGHATVVGGHATVGRLSKKVFWTFQAIRKIFEKRRWTVTRQWSEVTRPSADCRTTFLDVSSN